MIFYDLSMKNHWPRLRHIPNLCLYLLNIINNIYIYIYIWKSMQIIKLYWKNMFLNRIFHIMDTSQWHNILSLKNTWGGWKNILKRNNMISMIYQWTTIAAIWYTYQMCTYIHIKTIYNKYNLHMKNHAISLKITSSS